MSADKVTPEMRAAMARLNVWEGKITNKKFKQSIKDGEIGEGLLDQLAAGEEALFTPKQVQEMTGIKKEMIYSWIHSGLLPNTGRIGGSYFVRKTDFDLLFEQSKIADLTSGER